MRHEEEATHETVGWSVLLLLMVVSLPLAALAFLVLRTLLIPVLVGGVVVMALVALFTPPPFRDRIERGWHLSRK